LIDAHEARLDLDPRRVIRAEKKRRDPLKHIEGEVDEGIAGDSQAPKGTMKTNASSTRSDVSPARSDTSPQVMVSAQASLKSLPLFSQIIRRFLIEGCELDAELPETVQCRLAIQEAVTNVLRHAYQNREPGRIELQLYREEEEVVARIRDEGVPFDPRGTQDVLEKLDEPAEGGYGLSIIAGVMTEVDYEFVAGKGNELVLRKRMW
jgi:serine/threonine-protein kinase RsbW